MKPTKNILLSLSLFFFCAATTFAQTNNLPPPQLNPLTNPSTGDGKFTISWQPVNGAFAYEVFEYTSNPPTWQPGSWNQYTVWGTGIQLKKTAPGIWYYQVRSIAYDGVNWTYGPLNGPTVTQIVQYYPAPVVNTPTSPSTGTYTISWQPVNSPDVYAYEVFEFTTNPPTWAPGSWKQYAVYDTKATFTKPTNGDFYYSVRPWASTSNYGWTYGDMSYPYVQQKVRFLPPPVVHAPTAPSYDGLYTIAWDPVPGALNYEVFEFNSNPPTWQAGSWKQYTVWGGNSLSLAGSCSTSLWYSVMTGSLDNQNPQQWIYSDLSAPLVRQDVQLLQGALNRSYTTGFAEEDNVNVPIYKKNTTSYRVTATHPTYTTSLNCSAADFWGNPASATIWKIGKRDNSAAEFQQSGPYSITFNPDTTASTSCPKGLGAGGANQLDFYFTLKPGYPRNNGLRLTLYFGNVTGSVNITGSYDVIKTNTGFHQRYDNYNGQTIYQSGQIVTYEFNPGSNERWDEGNNTFHVGIRASTTTASATFDCIKLEAIPDALWSIGSLHPQGNTLKASGFSDGNTYYVQDLPAAGTDQPSTEFPNTINDSTIKNQYIVFTTQSGSQTVWGGKLDVRFWQVNGTLSIRARTWNGSTWVDQGNKVFNSTALNQTWSLPPGTFIEGADANKVWLHVETAAEGGPSTAGANGSYYYLALHQDFQPETSQQLYNANGTIVTGVNIDGWWRGYRTMNVSINGGTPVACHYFKINKQIPNTTSYPEIFVMYEDGNARIIPFPKTTQTSVPYGSSVILGAAAKSSRPYVDINAININPTAMTADVTYADGKKATLSISPAPDRSQTVVNVSNITYDTINMPFATLRSMWVQDGYSDVDTIQTSAGDNPILGTWSVLNDTFWSFKRKTPSIHNTWAPDIRIEQTGSQ